MLTLQAVLFCIILTTSWCFMDLSFPPGFKFGVASSAYQTEGSWNISDKSESILDHYTHTYPEKIADRTNGDVACDSYKHWRRDIQMVHELGVHFYNVALPLKKQRDLGARWCISYGEISLPNHMFWLEPFAAGDELITELAQENSAGRYSHPIFSKEGGWPPTIVEALALNSKRQGYPKSNFPTLTKEEIELMRGTYDFYAMNHYSSRQVRKGKSGEKYGTWPMNDLPDLDVKMSGHPNWEKAVSSWFHVNPPGIRNQLVWLKKHYGDLKFIIAENGYPTKIGLHDPDRIEYIHDNLEQVLLAIREDGVNVTAYTVWSLMDNFEWMDGYRSKFGLFQVDFSSPERTRTPRASAHYYRKVIKAHSLDVPRPHFPEEPLCAEASRTHIIVPSITLISCLIKLSI